MQTELRRSKSGSLPHVLVLLAAAALLFLRHPDQFANPQLWAEDGIFFLQAFEHGWRALGMGHAGYYHLAPRLVGGVATLVDPAAVPHAFVGCTLLLTLYVVSRALSPRCPLPLRPLCALAIVLVPDANEVLLNAVNLQWIFSAGLVLLLFSAEPERFAQRVDDLLSAVVFGLTGPFCILVTPLFIGRALLRRTSTSFVLAGTIATCAIVQAISIVRHPMPTPPNATFDATAAAGYAGIRVLGGLFLGAAHPPSLPTGVAIALTVATFALIAFLGLRRGRYRVQRMALALVFAASLASTLYRCWHSMPALSGLGNASRYVFPLQLMVLWLLIASARDRRRWLRVICLGAAGWALLVNLPKLRQAPLPDKHWERYAENLRRGEEVTIPINPDGWNFTFRARPR
jgi:hypothetical protein